MKVVRVVAAVICDSLERPTKIFATARGYDTIVVSPFLTDSVVLKMAGNAKSKKLITRITSASKKVFEAFDEVWIPKEEILNNEILEEVYCLAETLVDGHQAVLMLDGDGIVIAHHAQRAHHVLPDLIVVAVAHRTEDPGTMDFVAVMLGVQHALGLGVDLVDLGVLGVEEVDGVARAAGRGPGGADLRAGRRGLLRARAAAARSHPGHRQ